MKITRADLILLLLAFTLPVADALAAAGAALDWLRTGVEQSLEQTPEALAGVGEVHGGAGEGGVAEEGVALEPDLAAIAYHADIRKRMVRRTTSGHGGP